MSRNRHILSVGALALSTVALVLSAVTLVLTLASKPEGRPRRQANPVFDRQPQEDTSLKSCLRAIRTYHRQADLHQAQSDPSHARAAVAQIISLKCAKQSHPDIQEALLDAYGRLARMHEQAGHLDDAERYLTLGAKRKGPPSFSRANLYIVRGDLLDARAERLGNAGRGEEADALRRQALDAFKISSRMHRQLMRDTAQ